jgi:hypothetical protein
VLKSLASLTLISVVESVGMSPARRLAEELRELDDSPADRQVFEETDDGWKLAALSVI